MNNEKHMGRVVVITGATGGLGRSLSLAFAYGGYEVIGIYRSDTASAEEIESECRAAGARCSFLRQDITDDLGWKQFDAAIEARQGASMTFIANASTQFIPKPLHLLDWAEIATLVDVNVNGTLSVLGRLLPYMVKGRRGTVITVLSSALKDPPKGFAAYVTAKSALEGLTRSVAAEYSDRGIRVFSVAPGFMRTGLTDGWNDHLRASILRRGGNTTSPADVARQILTLVEDPEAKGHGESYVLNGTDDGASAAA